MLVTSISLIFGRKFIYAPFFELKKTEGFVINKISLLLQLLLTAVFMGGIMSFIFLVPIHHETCPQRSFSFWCMDLGGRGWRYFWFPTLLLFYWMFFLMMINGFTQAILTELDMPNPSRKSKQKKNQQQINNACLKTKKGMTVFSLIFIAIVILIYFLEIKWREKAQQAVE